MRYQYIREHRQEFSVKRMCQLLGVTRSGYYAWQTETTGPRQVENRVLVEQIRVEYKLSRQTLTAKENRPCTLADGGG